MTPTNSGQREILNVTEASEYLRLSESVVRRLIREKKIPYNKIEGRYLFFVPNLRGWLTAEAVQPVNDPGTSDDEMVTEITDKIWEKAQGE